MTLASCVYVLVGAGGKEWRLCVYVCIYITHAHIYGRVSDVSVCVCEFLPRAANVPKSPFASLF